MHKLLVKCVTKPKQTKIEKWKENILYFSKNKFYVMVPSLLTQKKKNTNEEKLCYNIDLKDKKEIS